MKVLRILLEYKNVNLRGINLSLIGFLLLAFISVPKVFSQEVETIRFKESLRKTSTVRMSDFVKELQYLPLETHENCLINKLKKVQYTENGIYILDDNPQGDRILLFNTEGRYVTKLAKKGRGPGEYQEISDFCVQSGSGYIFLLGALNVVHVYDAQFNHVRSFSTPKGSAIGADGERIYIYYGWPYLLRNEGYSVSVYDLEGKLLGRELYRKWACGYTFEEMNKAAANGCFLLQQNRDNSLVFWESGFDTVYICREGQFTPISVHQVPDKAPLELFREKSQEAIRNNFRMYYYRYHPLGDFLRALYKNEYYVFYFNRTDRALHYISQGDKSFYTYQSYGGYANDLDGGLDFQAMISDGEFMYAHAYAHNFIELIAEMKKGNRGRKEPDQELKAMIDTMSIEDNPILIKAVLK